MAASLEVLSNLWANETTPEYMLRTLVLAGALSIRHRSD